MFPAHFFAFLVLIAALGGAVPSFVRMYKDFDVELPPMTQWVFRLSHVVVSYWYLILPLGMGIDAVILGRLSLLPDETNWLGTLWAVLVLLATILLLGLVIVALAMPLWSIDYLVP
jgi:hypothetical protein